MEKKFMKAHFLDGHGQEENFNFSLYTPNAKAEVKK